ncbi:hypothetical protein EZS27_030782 [termite gut metagenome]|uniref:H repeat-associated protein N-terminal domain-containing protein n=1 Tax=termite gut metagenome TaxID=433724 RepID=A0A5J4QBF8_9ZZZZ
MDILQTYFSGIADPRVEGRCLHKLSDILMTGICPYLSCVVDYQDMHLFAKERGSQLQVLFQLPHGAPSTDTFERVFKLVNSKSLQQCLAH